MLKIVFNVLLAVSAGAENPHPSRGTQSEAEPPKPAQPSLVKMLQDLRLSDQQELFFMQLPDCMPVRVSTPSTESSLGSPTADRRAAHLHGQVSNCDLCMFITCFTEYRISKAKEAGA